MKSNTQITIQATHHAHTGCNDLCSKWRQCIDDKLWLDGPLPCEGLLDDEIGVEFERDSSPSYWVIPLSVNVSLPV